jgi:hypothetical protein
MSIIRVLIAVIMTSTMLFGTISPSLNVAKLETNLSQTGTTYEKAIITFGYNSEEADKEFELIKCEIPEIQDIVKLETLLLAKGELEVRYASVFTVDREAAKEYGFKKYQTVINELVLMAKNQGYDISADLNDTNLQAYAKQQFLITDDHVLIDFIKFIDIYENYAYNDEMRSIVEKLEAHTFASVDELLANEELFELLNMMPVTIKSTQEHCPTPRGDKNSETGLPGYNANDAVSYAASWWNKTNNTDYGYYANYYQHPDPTNNNMWSGGSGNNHRTWSDCADYVSQCLAAGGAPEIKKGLITPHTRTGNWYYRDSRPSHTWGGASNFFNHWSDRVGVRAYADQTKKGDPFSVDYGGDSIPDHTLIITYVSGTSLSNMKYACHTSDQYNSSGKSLQTIYNNSEAVWIYKVG